MTQIYYVELNLACIILLFSGQGQGYRKAEQLSTARITFNRMIWATIVLACPIWCPACPAD